MSDSLSIATLSAQDDLSDWDGFVRISPQGSVFCRSFWLKASTGNSFRILTLQRDGRIIAGMPLPIRIGRLGRQSITMPGLTQTLGVLLSQSKKATYEGRLSEEIEATSQLVKALPEVGYFSLSFNYNFKNWTPFYWEGYQQTTSYTYVLHDISDIERVIGAFDHSKRKNLRKASGIVEVKEDMSASEFYAHHQMTLGKLGQQVHYTREFFSGLVDASVAHNAGKTFFAIDKQGHVHAAVFIVYDRNSAYYLVSSLDPEFRASGALTLLIMRAIEFSSQHAARFDFEGSMMPGVEGSFRRFGGELMPYSRIWKDRRSRAERFLVSLWLSLDSLYPRRGAPLASAPRGEA